VIIIFIIYRLNDFPRNGLRKFAINIDIGLHAGHVPYHGVNVVSLAVDQSGKLVGYPLGAFEPLSNPRNSLVGMRIESKPIGLNITICIAGNSRTIYID